IDYNNTDLVLPIRKNELKAEPMLCCHQCPKGRTYRLGTCGGLDHGAVWIGAIYGKSDLTRDFPWGEGQPSKLYGNKPEHCLSLHKSPGRPFFYNDANCNE
ncbi:unnamed protein product, partial [Meganyctiphanes norvegica]